MHRSLVSWNNSPIFVLDDVQVSTEKYQSPSSSSRREGRMQLVLCNVVRLLVNDRHEFD